MSAIEVERAPAPSTSAPPRRWPRVVLVVLALLTLAVLALGWRYGVVGWLLPHTPAPLEVSAEVELSGPIADEGGSATVDVDPVLPANGTARADLRVVLPAGVQNLVQEVGWNAQLADGRGTLIVSEPGCQPEASRFPFPVSTCAMGLNVYGAGRPVPLTLHSQVGRHVAAPGTYVQELELPLHGSGGRRVLQGSVARITYRLTAVPDRSGL